MLEHLTTEFVDYEVKVTSDGFIIVNSTESDPSELCTFSAEQWAAINRLVELMKEEVNRK